MKVNKFAAAIAYAVLILISFVMIYPFLWMFFSSFKTNLEIMQDPLSLWPKEWVLTGYQNIATLAGNSIWHYIKNSLILSIGTTLVVVLSTALGGYALYRNRRLGRGAALLPLQAVL